MAGEEYQIGSANTENIGNLLKNLGWQKKVSQDINVECDICPPTQGGKKKTHGIDLFMTIKCPYSGISRGILIDGKRYAQTSLNNNTLSTWLRHLKTEVEHLDSSMPRLIEDFDLPQNTIIDTGIIALHCHEGYEHKKIAQYIKEIQFAGRSEKKLSFMIFPNWSLDKIASISNLRQKYSLMEFPYYNSSSLIWDEAITPELIMSTIIPFQYKPYQDESYKTGIIFYDYNPKNTKCLIPFFNYIQFASHREIEVFVPCKYSDLRHYDALMKSSLEEFSLNKKLNIKFNTLDLVTYNS